MSISQLKLREGLQYTYGEDTIKEMDTIVKALNAIHDTYSQYHGGKPLDDFKEYVGKQADIIRMTLLKAKHWERPSEAIGVGFNNLFEVVKAEDESGVGISFVQQFSDDLTDARGIYSLLVYNLNILGIVATFIELGIVDTDHEMFLASFTRLDSLKKYSPHRISLAGAVYQYCMTIIKIKDGVNQLKRITDSVPRPMPSEMIAKTFDDRVCDAIKRHL